MLSNSCGCQETTVRIDEALVGTPPGATMVVKSALGEWCKPSLDVTHAPMLIHVEDGVISGAVLDQVGDQRRFEAKRLWKVMGVRSDTLAIDQDGRASLAELLARIGAQR